MRFSRLLTALALALLLPAAACAAGLPLTKKVIHLTNKDSNITVAYPLTGNKAIDTALTAYAQNSATLFKTYHPDFANNDHQYELDTSYAVERNDAQVFAVVFTEYSDTGGAHPNTEYRTFNFLMPDGAQVFLGEILDGPNGLDRVSRLATARLNKDIAGGTDSLSDEDTIRHGAGPLADNFKDFVILPSKLHIYFPPYQVAPYAAGPQEVTLPLQALKDVIRADWRAPAPGFNCREAATPIERAICADSALARLDRQMGEAYLAKLYWAYEAAEIAKLKQTQHDWLMTRNKSCGGSVPGTCLTKLYRARLAVLTKP